MKELLLAQNSLWFSSIPLDSLHIWDPTLGGVFFTISTICHYLGGSSFFLSIISFVYIYYRPKLALELSLSLLTSGIAVYIFKFFLESPRPFPYPEAFDEKAFGLPSGHVYSAVVVWGLLAYRIPKLWFRILSLFIILVMPLSRMYLKVHYLGDVGLGFGLGIIHLLTIIWFLNQFYSKDEKRIFIETKNYRTLGLLGIVLTLAPIALDSPYLSEEHHYSLRGLLMASGALGGFWLGVLFYPRFSKPEFLDWTLPKFSFSFRTKEFRIFWNTVLVRLLVLAIVITVLYIIPGNIIKASVWQDDLFLRYMRYLVVGFALVAIVPLVLQKIQKGKFLQN
ncbi:phosphatase PAP2 family protein [Leptospira mtsangambouensis]|nr:phosphatase PAP2 family protein [Leptospira mtsangambouensis]